MIKIEETNINFAKDLGNPISNNMSTTLWFLMLTNLKWDPPNRNGSSSISLKVTYITFTIEFWFCNLDLKPRKLRPNSSKGKITWT